MADEIRQFTVTIPAGTPQAAPVTIDVSFPPREVSELQIVVPAGGNGVMGFQVQNSGLAVIPYDSDDWIIANNEVISWPLSGYINSGSWQIAGYNTGSLDHSLYVRFLLNLVTDTSANVSTAPLDTDSISSPADAQLSNSSGADVPGSITI